MENTQDHIFSQQVSQIYAQSIISLLGVMAVSLVTLFLFWQPQEFHALLTWFACLSGHSLVRYALLTAYRRDQLRVQHARKWAGRYSLLELVSGFIWATLLIWVAPSTEIQQILVMMILGSMATSGLPVLSFVLSIYAAFLFSLGLTATLILLALNQTDSNYLALFTLFYTLGLWFSARTNYRRNLSNLVLAQEKLALVESLQLTNKQLLRQVNETQNAEQNAREAEGRFRTLANATSEGVVLYENGRIIDCNENITTMLGYTRAELLDKNIEHLFTQTDRFLVLDLLSHNDGIPYELRCEDKEGNNFPVELVKRKLPLHDRNLYVFALRDISELKYMSEIKDQFISTVSHELRTPITSIHASLALALGGVAGDIPEKLQSLLSIAHQNSERLNLLINDLLDIQKLEIGKLHFNYETVDVTDVLKHSIELNSAYFNKHHIKVVLQDIDQKLFIHVDRDRFIQVLTNLLSNAAKFSPADSEVSISLSLQTELLQIHIHDQGPGIPPEFQEKIFQRFSQADASNTRVHGGSGLGLYISKKILHEMKSDIDFRSTAGEGTTFTITLPVTTK